MVSAGEKVSVEDEQRAEPGAEKAAPACTQSGAPPNDPSRPPSLESGQDSLAGSPASDDNNHAAKDNSDGKGNSNTSKTAATNAVNTDDGDDSMKHTQNARKRPGKAAPKERVSSCQVDGCQASVIEKCIRDLRICDEHRCALLIEVMGVKGRFCQQCSRFHSLDAYDGNRRGCRRRLAALVQRNRHRRVTSDKPDNGSSMISDASQDTRAVPYSPSKASNAATQDNYSRDSSDVRGVSHGEAHASGRRQADLPEGYPVDADTENRQAAWARQYWAEGNSGMVPPWMCRPPMPPSRFGMCDPKDAPREGMWGAPPFWAAPRDAEEAMQFERWKYYYDAYAADNAWMSSPWMMGSRMPYPSMPHDEAEAAGKYPPPPSWWGTGQPEDTAAPPSQYDSRFPWSRWNSGPRGMSAWDAYALDRPRGPMMYGMPGDHPTESGRPGWYDAKRFSNDGHEPRPADGKPAHSRPDDSTQEAQNTKRPRRQERELAK